MENGEVLITLRHIKMLVRLALAQNMSLASELSAWYFGKIAEFQRRQELTQTGFLIEKWRR